MTRLERYIDTLNKAKNRTAILSVQFNDFGDMVSGRRLTMTLNIIIDGISVHNSYHNLDPEGDVRSQERKVMDRVLFSIFVKGLAHD